jgi:hypothetical protein
VRVTAVRTAPLIFGRIFGRQSDDITRRATAWIANINSDDNCVQPWALPYTGLYNMVTGSTATGTGQPNLTQTQLASIDDLAEGSRILILRGPNTAGSFFSHGAWNGYTLSGNPGNASYQGGIYGCNGENVRVDYGNGNTLAGSGNQYECWTILALMGSGQNACASNQHLEPNVNQTVTCAYPAPAETGTHRTYDARCNGNTGVTRHVVWGDNVANGTNGTDFRLLGRIRLLCAFRDPPSPLSVGSGNNAVQYTTSETCNVGTTSLTDLPMGTLVVLVEALQHPVLEAGVDLGNTISGYQRLILVE